MMKKAIISKIEQRFSQAPSKLKEEIQILIENKVDQLIDKVKTDTEAIPVILVGGGSPILPHKMKGVSEIIRPEHYEVANAYGASIAQIGGEAEKVFNLSTISREAAIEEVKNLATQNAITAGAIEKSIQVLIVQDSPLAYLPNATKVKVKVCGDLG